MSLKDLIVILGPTAVGKTSLAAKLAFEFNGEIISADSRQVYKSMNLGTGKDYSDYIFDGKEIPYHLIDVVEPTDEYNLFRFLKDYQSAFKEIKQKNKMPFLVGGTGLFIDSVLSGYRLKEVPDEQDLRNELEKMPLGQLQLFLQTLKANLHNTTDIFDKKRVIRAIEIAMQGNVQNNVTEIPNAIIIGINPGRQIIKKRITQRLKDRFSAGMIDEVKTLLDSGITYEKLIFFGLEYKFISLYLSGKLNYNDMFQKLNSAIADFAKKQMTWFRKMEKNGVKINWIDKPDIEIARNIIFENLR